MHLSDISWEQCAEYLAQDNRIILPIGATEQHGRHLGLGTDYLIAAELAHRVGAQTRVLVAPSLNYGMSHFHLDFVGTVSLSPTTLIAVLQDILLSLYRHGFRRVMVVNGHGANQSSIHSASMIVLNQFPDLRVKAIAWWMDPEVTRIIDQAAGTQQGLHGSNHETSFLQTIAPHAVHLERLAKRDAPLIPSFEFESRVSAFREKYPDGVMGLDPSHANAELGQRILERAVAFGIKEIENW